MIVRGDVAGCEALARALSRAADGVASAGDALAAARGATPSWKGDAGDGWRELAGRQRAAADDLAATLAAAGRAVQRFAADLAEAQHLARQADEPDAPWLVARAKEAERAAHETLVSALRGLPVGSRTPGPAGGAQGAVVGWDDLVMIAHDLALSSRDIADGQAALAAAHGAFARQVRTAAGQASGAEAAALRRLRNAELREMRAWRGSATTWAARADGVQRVVPWARYAGRPVAAAVPVLRGVPVVGVFTTGAGIAVDVASGKDPGTAVASNVAAATAATVAAPVITAGAAALLGTATVAAAPVLIGVAAAAFIGIGVGAAVEEWGDDVVDAVGDAAGGAKDLAGKAWNAVFG
ncbi:MAG: hypothetical protein ACLGIG_09140 [Actinomycetes bacterium]